MSSHLRKIGPDFSLCGTELCLPSACQQIPNTGPLKQPYGPQLRKGYNPPLLSLFSPYCPCPLPSFHLTTSKFRISSLAICLLVMSSYTIFVCLLFFFSFLFILLENKTQICSASWLIHLTVSGVLYNSSTNAMGVTSHLKMYLRPTLRWELYLAVLIEPAVR